MTMAQSTKVCAVCKTALTITTTNEYLGDPMHRICGPGSARQNTVVVKTHCGVCGIVYVNGGGVDPK